MKFCLGCKNYLACVTLCPEAKRYVSQDEVKLREFTIGIPTFCATLPPVVPHKISLTPAERRLAILLRSNVGREIASQVLGISPKRGRNQISLLKLKYGCNLLPETPENPFGAQGS